MSNDKKDEFLKIAMKSGKIKDIKEAFKNYPVEEEWHQGRIENFGMLISSNLKKIKYQSNKLLEKDTMNGLDKNSLVKTDVIYKISNNQILFKIGEVSLNKVEEYKEAFYKNCYCSALVFVFL